MLDARLYRAAFVPVVLALLVVAFSLERRPVPATTVFAADAFSGPRAFATLRELAAAYPDRRPGSRDEEELARRLATTWRESGFQVTRVTSGGRPAGGALDSETVIGVRPGVSSRRIVVVADRAALSRPGAAELSGTAALVELSRIFRVTEGRRPGDEAATRAVGRDLRRTLVLVSTSGATLGGGVPGARAIAQAAAPEDGAADAVLVLGDLAGAQVRKPWVVPWSDGRRRPPLGLRRTVEAAVRAEVGSSPGGPRAVTQWARRAFPLTVSGQGEPAAAGLPAVALQVSGERGPSPGTPVSEGRLGAFGRAALRTVTAVDEIGVPASSAGRAGPAEGGPAAFAGEKDGIVTVRRLLPAWAIRLVVLAVLLPALLASLDALFRARRRRLPMGRWLAWVAVRALPLVAGYAWLRLLGAVGAIDAPAAPVLPSAVALGTGEILALVSVPLVLVSVWLGVRRAAPALSAAPGPIADGAPAAAIGALLSMAALLVWLWNPYAAALLVPSAHLWLLTADPGSRMPWPLAVAAALAGLLPIALLTLIYAVALGLGPASVVWLGVLVVAGGHVSPPAALVLTLVVAAALATAAALLAGRRLGRAGTERELDGIRTRGQGGMRHYAGPGSLGGTESALRR